MGNGQAVEKESSDGRVRQEALRFLVVHSSQLAQQRRQTSASAHAKEAEALTEHVRRVHARWFACEADTAAAIAASEHHEPGRRGRRPHPWRDPAGRYQVVADARCTRRARRGRPAKTDPPPLEAGYRLVVDVETRATPGGGLGMAGAGHHRARGGGQRCRHSPSLSGPKYHGRAGVALDQEPRGDRSRMAGKARTDRGMGHAHGAGLAGLQRHPALGPAVPACQARQLPGNKGLTATPTAAVVLALFAQIALVHFRIDAQEIVQLSGVQSSHLLVCDALGLEHSWYEEPLAHKIDQFSQTP